MIANKENNILLELRVYYDDEDEMPTGQPKVEKIFNFCAIRERERESVYIIHVCVVIFFLELNKNKK